MKNTLFRQLSIIFFILGFSSCSSVEELKDYNSKLLTFNIYEQSLEKILEVVADRYELDLDFDVDDTEQNFSLSVQNASVNDILKKLSSYTGFYMKVIDDEIIVDDETMNEDMTEITLNLNENLWKDIRIGSKELSVDEETVKAFFGPLFSNIEVEDVNAYRKTITLYLLKEDVAFIEKSLLYLNYLKHKRNLVITVWVADKSKNEVFLQGKNQSKDAVFAWKLNAGDNIAFTQDNGDKVTLNSQLLSQENNISQNEVFIKLQYNKAKVEHNFNFSKAAIQTVNLSNKLSLIVKANWYVEGNEIIPENFNSTSISSFKKAYSEKISSILSSRKTLSKGKVSAVQAVQSFLKDGVNCRVVSLTTDQNSDVDRLSINTEAKEYTLAQLLDLVTTETSASYFADENGILIDCQGTIPNSRNVVWKINSEPFGASYLRFRNGAFLVEKEGLNKPLVYLPSANALVGIKSSNILKD
ncbi:MAG: hypothetical protein NE327_11545 [Lentisphaeraceae bacterium]|nr:hypothetical protein [Lentisphaeraceae bacterium]